MANSFFQVASASDAWLHAARAICTQGELVGLHVVIASPLTSDEAVVDALDARLANQKCISTKDVAYTIFPDGLWRKNAQRDATKLFDLYNKPGGFYERLQSHRKRSRGRKDWGTYFQRLSSAEFTGRGEGQLATAIRALCWERKPRGAVHLHASSPRDDYELLAGLPADGMRPRGGPACLQTITLHVETNEAGSQVLSACALYRNHDFFEKALGNYIALGQLLNFLAESSGLSVGKLHVISGHAYASKVPPVKEVLNGFDV
jgi:thymidylate synthase